MCPCRLIQFRIALRRDTANRTPCRSLGEHTGGGSTCSASMFRTDWPWPDRSCGPPNCDVPRNLLLDECECDGSRHGANCQGNRRSRAVGRSRECTTAIAPGLLAVQTITASPALHFRSVLTLREYRCRAAWRG